MLVGVGFGRPPMHAANFGGDHEAVARLVAQHMTKAQLALAVAVPGRGVEIADAGGMCGLDGGAGLRLGNALAHVAQARAAQAELRDLQRRLADRTSKEGVHVVCRLASKFRYATS